MTLIKSRLLCFFALAFAIACNAPSNQNSPPVPAASPAASTATPDELAGTRAIYSRDCVACHGENGQGGTVKVEAGTLKVPSLREGHALKHPDSEFIDQIRDGGDGMPAFKDKLNSEEMSKLARFIRREFQGGIAPPPEPPKK